MVTMHTAAERPDLWKRGIDSASVWPEYNLHGDVLNQWWGLLDVELADFQFVLYDEADDAVIAEGHTGPLVWDGDDETLPPASTPASAGLRAQPRGSRREHLVRVGGGEPARRRRRGLAGSSSARCATIAERHGLAHLIAPVRPSWKERYPITPIEHYVTYRRDDGQLLDPWMRVHERLGARVGAPLPESLRITGTVAEWESWTGLSFPPPVTTCSRRGWPRCTSTRSRIAGPIGSRTSG